MWRLLGVFKHIDEKIHWVVICAADSFPSEFMASGVRGLRPYICAKTPYAEYVAARQICEAGQSVARGCQVIDEC